MKAYFITATDTDAGKTFITAGLLKHLSEQGHKTLGFKPVASGCRLTAQGWQNDDAVQIMQAANIQLPYRLINPYAFAPAIAPHIAARQDGIRIELAGIADVIEQHKHQADYILVEGVGGWLVPLNDRETVADLARLVNFPVILVVNMRLGCINHALLTVRAITETGLPLAGWIANCVPGEPIMDCLEDNVRSLQARIAAPLLGLVPDLSLSKQERSSAGFIDLEKCN